ncbi:cation transporter, partial [Pseudoxanthomonas sp. SGD-10]
MEAKKRIVLIALCVSSILMLVKFCAFFITGSNAILTDAAESIVNVLASTFAFFSIYFSSLPRDQNHPYGHGKIEFFSAFIEGILIIIAGILILIKSVYNLFYPEPIQELVNGVFLIAFTGLINGGLGWYMIKKGKLLNSLTLIADGKHLGTDAISSVGLIFGLTLIYLTDLLWLDSVISFVLVIYIVYNGYKLTRTSVGGLMDESDLNIVKQVVKYFNLFRKDEWIDVHNLRVQRYGATYHIDCHVTLPYYFDLVQVH